MSKTGCKDRNSLVKVGKEEGEKGAKREKGAKGEGTKRENALGSWMSEILVNWKAEVLRGDIIAILGVFGS